MQLKISLLTKILGNNTITFYLLYKDKGNALNRVLPIEIPIMIKKYTEDTYLRTLKALKAEIESLHTYLYLENSYYVYLRVLYNNNVFDINTTIENAFNILYYKPEVKIFIEEDILEQQGIIISKELINSYESIDDYEINP